MLSILVGSVVIFIFGAIWFTVLFGKKWAELMDFNPAGDAKAKKMGMVKPLIMNFLTNVIVASVLFYIFPQFLAVSYFDFLKTVLIIWLGFSFPIYANAAIWERKSWELVVINSAQSIIAFALLSSVVYYMS
jgi:biotin transporter BioY